MLDKLKAAIIRAREAAVHWIRRCNGADILGLCIVIVALVLALLGRLLRVGGLVVLSALLFIWALFRMLSHNVAGRHEENRRFSDSYNRCRRELTQWTMRVKNSRKYKYYRCPGCKARLRMPRGIGEKTVTCSRCGYTFRQKA